MYLRSLKWTGIWIWKGVDGTHLDAFGYLLLISSAGSSNTLNFSRSFVCCTVGEKILFKYYSRCIFESSLILYAGRKIQEGPIVLFNSADNWFFVDFHAFNCFCLINKDLFWHDWKTKHGTFLYSFRFQWLQSWVWYEYFLLLPNCWTLF